MAIVYDHLMNHAPYDQWVAFSEEAIHSSKKPINKIMDLGCGTGEITIRLSNKGYEMVGVDYSTAMLNHAKKKAVSENAASIQWVHQDIKELEGFEAVDMAISFCDVINYLIKPEDIEQAFLRISESLKPGGLFLFDVHHLPFIMEYYMNETFADVTDEAAYIWFCHPGEAYGEMIHDLTFFYLNKGMYEKVTEKHYQRAYSINFYKEILKRTGFENIKVTADFATKHQNIDENATRIFFSATKESR